MLVSQLGLSIEELVVAIVTFECCLRAKPALVRAEVARVVRASQQRAPAEEELALFAAVETASAPPAAADAKKAAGMV